MALAFSSTYRFRSKPAFLESKMPKIFIIEDDAWMAECVARAINTLPGAFTIDIFENAIAAMSALSDCPDALPDLILLDILLDGPDGFTLLHELSSYDDTARIPIILVTSLRLNLADLTIYNVQNILYKDQMTPSEIAETVQHVL